MSRAGSRELLLACAMLFAVPAAAQPAPPSLDDCDAAVARAPGDLDAYQCFRRYYELTRDSDGAVARLEALAARDPGNPHPRVMLARVLPFKQRTRSIELLTEAIADYGEAGEPVAQGQAYCYRSWYHLIGRDFEASKSDARRGQALGEETGDAKLLLYCRLQESRPSILDGDQASAWGLLRSIELHPHFDELSVDLRSGAMEFLGVVAGNLGMDAVAMNYRKRLIAMGEAEGLPDLVSSGYSGAAFLAARMLRQGTITREEAYFFGREAVAHARSPLYQGYARLELAAVAPWDEAKAILQDLIESRAEGRVNALTIMGTRTIEEEPESWASGEAYLVRALEAARAADSPLQIASAISNLSQARLRYRRDAEALALAEQTLDAVEVLQEWQTGETIGAVLAARFAPQYYELFDALVDDWSAGNVYGLEEALAVSERYRSRVLRNHLQRIGAGREFAPEDRQKLESKLRQISALQLRVLSGQGTDDEQDAWTREAMGLEEEVRLLREESGPGNPRAPMEREQLPTRSEIQAALNADEAILSYMSSTDRELGSWMLLLTPTELQVFPLPPRQELETTVRFWLGLIVERDDTVVEGAARLWRELVEAPLAELPEGVTRLVIVPDGPLHELPFDALRPGPGEASLGERFEIALAPSATIWKALREGAPLGAAGTPRGLFIADPWHPVDESSPALLRSARRMTRGLGPLPHARSEVRAARRELGSGVEILEGEGATESALKSRSLQGVRVLHFAAHALLDAEIPERSSVLMAPGGDEDGLLQAREILALRLDGALVTLSACQSAAGRAVAGEGVLGLSRAFFQAGASTVIGSLWPVRDEETASLMSAFYERLGRGASPLAALSAAKRAMAAEGAPPAAWAGVVLIGDGDGLTWPEGAGKAAFPRAALVAAALALFALALLAGVAISRRRA